MLFVPFVSLNLFHTQGGNLVERRLRQRKWKWIVHGSPKDHLLTSITPVSQDELNEKSYSLFLTSATGFIFEYHILKHSGKLISKGVAIYDTQI